MAVPEGTLLDLCRGLSSCCDPGNRICEYPSSAADPEAGGGKRRRHGTCPGGRWSLRGNFRLKRPDQRKPGRGDGFGPAQDRHVSGQGYPYRKSGTRTFEGRAGFGRQSDCFRDAAAPDLDSAGHHSELKKTVGDPSGLSGIQPIGSFLAFYK